MEGVVELVTEGTILGGLIDVTGDGKTTLNISEISTEGKSPQQIAKELKEAGLPVPEDSGAKTAAELADEMEKERYYTEEEIKELINHLRTVLYDAFLTSGIEINEDANGYNEDSGDFYEDADDYNQQANEENAYKGKYPSKAEIVGNYYGDSSLYDEEFMLIFLMDDEGELTDRYGYPFDYDPSTGIGSFSRGHSGVQNIEEYQFSYRNGGIHASGCVWYNYELVSSMEMDRIY